MGGDEDIMDGQEESKSLELVQARCVYRRRLPGATYHVLDYFISLRKWFVPPTAPFFLPSLSAFFFFLQPQLSNFNLHPAPSRTPPRETQHSHSRLQDFFPSKKKTRLRRSDLPSSISWIAAPELCTSCLTPKSVHQTHARRYGRGSLV